jgi:SNF2 family DNA or RNA helicase
MVSEDSADRHSEVMNDFQNSSWYSVFITTTKIGGTGLNLMAANHAVILQKPWVLNEQRQAFGRIV